MIFVILALASVNYCYGDILYQPWTEYSSTTPTPPINPYSFQYKAGRYPGHVDRFHQETSDGSGTVHGSFSYIDPKHKIRTIEYVADEKGFHPSLINYEDTMRAPVDSEAVQIAKAKHFQLYEKIALANAQGQSTNLPKDSPSVARAKNNHFQLFSKIAQEHASIARQRDAERLAYEATSIANVVDEN